MAKYINLSQGKIATVNDEDYEYLSQWKWTAHNRNGRWYAIRTKRKNGKQKQFHMHRVIAKDRMGLDIDGYDIDHRNRNGIDNRRDNLRVATRSQNLQNSKHRLGGESDYKGVHRSTSNNWVASINSNGESIYLGTFGTEREAAAAYNHAARERHGEFAYLNDISGWEFVALNRIERVPASGYIGVTMHKPSQRWHAVVWFSGKQRSLGYYDTPEDAAVAVNYGRLRYHGDSAEFNDIQGWRNTRPSRRIPSSAYKGVSKSKSGKRWRATIGANGKSHYLGTFDTEEEAAIAYNYAAIKFFGKNAELNQIPQST